MHSKHILTLLIFLFVGSIQERKRHPTSWVMTHHPLAGGFGSGQRLNSNHGYECPSQTMFRHVKLTSIGKRKCPTSTYIKTKLQRTTSY
jgi:hypothetical protein